MQLSKIKSYFFLFKYCNFFSSQLFVRQAKISKKSNCNSQKEMKIAISVNMALGRLPKLIKDILLDKANRNIS